MDGAAYTNLITLTASNTPTLTLTSTGVGTINNMSIGATTASTGAFTTLTSTGASSFATSSGDVGIGTTSPAYNLEVSKSQDTLTNIAVTNASAGTAAQTRLRLNNGGSNFGTITHTGASFTTSGVFRADGTYIFGNGTGGLTLTTGAAQPIYFAISNSEVARFDTSGKLLVGSTSSFGVVNGEISVKAASGGAGVALWDSGVSSKFQLIAGAGGVNAFGLYDISASAYRWTVDSSGNLGIGQTAPIAKLDIGGISTTQNGLVLTTSSGVLALAAFTTDTSTGEIRIGGTVAAAGNYFPCFYASGSERARIDTSGNLMVGTSNSSGTVGAGFKVLGGRPVTVNAASTDGTTIYEAYSTGAAAYRFYVGMGGTIFATSATITPIISDERLKQNIVDYSNGLSQVLGLRPRYFEYKKEPGRKLAGFISQEVQTVMPEAIVPTREDPEMMTYSIDWYPLFVKAIQEQQAIIQTLTARITALEGA